MDNAYIVLIIISVLIIACTIILFYYVYKDAISDCRQQLKLCQKDKINKIEPAEVKIIKVQESISKNTSLQNQQSELNKNDMIFIGNIIRKNDVPNDKYKILKLYAIKYIYKDTYKYYAQLVDDTEKYYIPVLKNPTSNYDFMRELYEDDEVYVTDPINDYYVLKELFYNYYLD